MDFDLVPARTGLLIVDLQNDFLHPKGAYARGGQTSDAIAALPARVLPVANALRAKGGWIVSTQFTLVPGKGGALYRATSEIDPTLFRQGGFHTRWLGPCAGR